MKFSTYDYVVVSEQQHMAMLKIMEDGGTTVGSSFSISSTLYW